MIFEVVVADTFDDKERA